MKLLLTIFLIVFIINFFFCQVELNEEIVQSFWKRVILLIIFSAIVTIFIGIPIVLITTLF